MAKKEEQTPMMKQYWQMRSSLPPDTLLMFRLGDFYEMFYDDAVEGARILGITLTKRQNYPMAGVPYHAAWQYIPKLLAAGKKVAVCDQDETPVAGKLVKRSISRIISSGTTLEENQMDGASRHYIMAVDISRERKLSAAWMDLSAGEFLCAAFDNPEDFLPVLSSCDPKEILLPEESSAVWKTDSSLAAWNAIFRNIIDLKPVTLLPDYHFDVAYGANTVRQSLKVLSLDGFGIESDFPALGAAGAICFYVTENLRRAPANLRILKKFSTADCMLIDPATQRNLEIFRASGGGVRGSLFDVMNRTRTPMGSRMLESFLAAPSLDLGEIKSRQDLVWELYSCPTQCAQISELLSKVRDIPRILGRLQNNLKNPRELAAILQSAEQFGPIKEALLQAGADSCRALAGSFEDFSGLIGYLKRALADELPSKIQDGGAIRDGFDEELDSLRRLGRDNLSWLSELEAAEIARTGIKNLRIKYNGAFGYFIEVTKSNLGLVPSDYIRRQTMTNAERFTTEQLRQKERDILHSQDRALAREEFLFGCVVDEVLKSAEALARCSQILARLDVMGGWAELSREWDYCRPKIDESDSIEISEGRHPEVEQMLRLDKLGLAGTQSFVPNDAYISSSDEQIALITGPNMAGKSTYIRQIALICIMAQTGCFVPAKHCSMGLVDRIFSRVGASDELSKGNSTFMVEMNETANILNNATDKSLIILDEIGRGTSTYDGLSIAWAIVEHLHGTGPRGPKTFFATHYHEITQLEKILPRVVNYRVSVKEWNDEIIFVRTIERGAADKSYGIQVARLAGLPQGVIDRAKQILSELETEGSIVVKNLDGQKFSATPRARRQPARRIEQDKPGNQMSLF